LNDRDNHGANGNVGCFFGGRGYGGGRDDGGGSIFFWEDGG
jgi:hypothetical protein